MIIYGYNSTAIATEQLVNITCPNCETKGEVYAFILRRHAHVFWIPLFPIGKIGVAQCQHCKSEFKKKQMPEDMKRAYQNVKSDARGPIWQFAGLGIIAVIAGAIYVNGIIKDGQNEDFIHAPLKGDVYECKTSNGYFTTLLVDGVNGDSVFVFENNYDTYSYYHCNSNKINSQQEQLNYAD